MRKMFFGYFGKKGFVMDYWKFSGQRLCTMADTVLKKYRATEEACQTAAAQLHAAAKQGYIGAYTRLARCYEKGIGVAKDETRAMEYYRAAGDCGDTEAAAAALKLNPLYQPKRLGDVTPEIDATYAKYTAQELFAMAEQATEEGTEREPSKLELYCGAAMLGHPQAAFLAAQALEKAGQTEKAVRLYNKAALQGIDEAQEAMVRLDESYDRDMPDTDLLSGDQLYELASDYRNGTGRPINEACSKRLNTLAAQRSNGKAALEIAQGLYEKEEYEEAVDYLRRAAAANAGDASAMLGLMTQQGQGGLTQDAAEAYRLFTRAAGQNSALGSYYAGVCCENGDGTEQHMRRAVEWYVKAAVQGEKRAAERLKTIGEETTDPLLKYRCGHFFLRGDREGKQQDFRLAFRLLSEAAEKEVPEAYFDLGLMYRDGRYVYDKHKARAYLDKAQKLGVTGAESERKKVYHRFAAYINEFVRAAIVLVLSFMAVLFVVDRLKALALLNTDGWNQPAMWGVFGVGALLILVKHYFIFKSYSVRPFWQDILFTIACPGIPIGVIAILANNGVWDLFAVATATMLGALLTVFLIRHNSAIKDALWVGLRLIIFMVGSILAMQAVSTVLAHYEKPLVFDWPEWIAIAVLAVCVLVLMAKQYYLYSERLEMENFLVGTTLALAWPGIFMAALLYFCWMIMPNVWILVFGTVIGTVLHVLISDNLWGARDSD